MGGPNTRETNLRWQMAAILKNQKSAISPQKVDRSAQNLAWRRILAFPIGLVGKISNSLKSKMADLHPRLMHVSLGPLLSSQMAS